MPQTRRKFDPKKVLAAVALHPNNAGAAAAFVGCSKFTLHAYLKRMDDEAGRPVIERGYAVRGPKKIKWNAANLAKLAKIFHRPVCPDDDAVAAEMGITVNALWAVKYRFGLGKRKLVGNGHCGRDAKRIYVQVNPKQIIPCLNCARPFGSHGNGNRLCIRCGGVGSYDQEEA